MTLRRAKSCHMALHAPAQHTGFGAASARGCSAISVRTWSRRCSPKPASSQPTSSRRSMRSATATAPPSKAPSPCRRAGGKPIAPGRRRAGTRLPCRAMGGGQELPQAVNAACIEIRGMRPRWRSGSAPFSPDPSTVAAHGSERQARVSGKRLADGAPCSSPSRRRAPTLGARHPRGARGRRQLPPLGRQDFHLRRRARPHRQHRASGARAPARCPGRAQRSLALRTRKSPPKADGTLGARNDARAHSIEHKLGIHGSPTCTMVYGPTRAAPPAFWSAMFHDDEPRTALCRSAGRGHRRARHAAGPRLCARAPARARGRRADGERDHRASRCAAHAPHHAAYPAPPAPFATPRRWTGAERSTGDAARRPRTRAPRCSLPSPRRFATSAARSPRVQVHGGMGYIEETGAGAALRRRAHCPDLRGPRVQAIDLTVLPLAQSRTVRAYLNEIARRTAVDRVNDAGFGWMGVRLRDALSMSRAHHALAAGARAHDAALAGATPYLRLFALTARGAAPPRRRSAARRLLPASRELMPAPASMAPTRPAASPSRGSSRRISRARSSAPSPKAPTPSPPPPLR